MLKPSDLTKESSEGALLIGEQVIDQVYYVSLFTTSDLIHNLTAYESLKRFTIVEMIILSFLVEHFFL